MDLAAQSHQPIIIVGKRNSAVLVSEEDWQAIHETMFLLSIPGMRKSTRGAKKVPLSKSAKKLNW
jgi:PHD/YefM family antitoxin component YafN of YafNO toxin-antitoxin module